ncbi:MAG: hypothetical protein JXA19_02175 [Anaerolineales bacterium]|nr:hypothetical protein [Anaerolineales bacterium]
MNSDRRNNLGWGVLLILVGAFFLAVQMGYINNVFDLYEWPVIIVGVGAIFILIAILTGASGMAIPGSIVGGVGMLLYYFNSTGRWGEWTLWTLIPAFVGLGTFIMYLLEGKFSAAVREGGSGILWGVVLYAILAAVFGGPLPFDKYWPIIIILVGFWFLIQPLFRRNHQPHHSPSEE